MNARLDKAISPPVEEALQKTVAIIPVWNEEEGIGPTLANLPEGVTPIVVDNGSTDRTIEIVESHGVPLVHESRKGYGSVCQAGIAAIPDIAPETEYVTFVDGDHADHTEELPDMLSLLVSGRADMVLGSRVLGEREKGALPIQSRFAILYSRLLLWRLFRVKFTDLGPFRVLRLDTLRQMNMEDISWGWTVEMQAKGALMGLRMRELPARYRRRVGDSKISGALKVAASAGWLILCTLLFWRFKAWKPLPLLLLLATLGIGFPAQATEFFGLGSRNASMAGSVSTVCTDGYAARLNPSLLGMLDVPSLNLGYAGMVPALQSKVEDPGSLGWISAYRAGQEDNPNQAATLDAVKSAFNGAGDIDYYSGVSFSFVLPLRRLIPSLPFRMGMGGAFVIPQGGSMLAGFTSRSPDAPFYPTLGAPFNLARIQFGLGAELLKERLWLGAGLAVHSRAEGEVLTLTPIASHGGGGSGSNPPTPSQAETTQNLKLDITPTVGLTVQPVTWLRGAFVWHGEEETSIHMGIEATMELNLGSPVRIELPYVMSGSFAYKPHRFVGGLAFVPDDKLTLTAEVQFGLWERFADHLQVLYFSVDEAALEEDGTVYVEDLGSDFAVDAVRRPGLQSRNTLTPRFGVEYRLDSLDLRAGYAYRPAPLAENQEHTNLLLDNSWHHITAGAGVYLKPKSKESSLQVLFNVHGEALVLNPRYNRVGRTDQQGNVYAKGLVLTQGAMYGFGAELVVEF
jgi:hypothetical protein